MTSGF